MQVVRATKQHIREVMNNLREESKEEIRLSGLTEEEAYEWATRSSQAWAVINPEGKAVCAWGLATGTQISDAAAVWLLGTDAVGENRVAFAYYSRRFIDELSTRYSRIHGLVNKDFESAKRWLAWLGFSIGPATGAECYFYKDNA